MRSAPAPLDTGIVRSRRARALRHRLALGLAAGSLTTALVLQVSSSPARASSETTAPGSGTTALVVSPAVPNGAVTVSPAPGSATADQATQLSFLGRPASQLGTITVVGSKSGVHSGVLRAYSTGNGASFLPDRPFIAGETVTVRTSLQIVGSSNGTYQFKVAHVVPLDIASSTPALDTGVAAVEHFASAPSVEPPSVTVQTNHEALAGKDIFLTPKGTTGQAGPMIVQPDGQLVWFHPLPKGEEAFDLDKQTLHGKPVLTWFQGKVVDGHGQGEVVIANRNYHTIAVVHGGNGTLIDLHDLKLTNRGTVFVTAYRTMRWDLTSDGGAADGTVFDGVIQEIDVKTGLVEEEWDSLDHVPVSASYFKAPLSPTAPFDYFHINSVQPLPGGDLLIGSRNTSAAYLVDPADKGDIMWTLGGKQSSFTMAPGARFWFQHDVRWRGDNELTIFDNGSAGGRGKESESRAIFEHLDMTTHTATLIGADTPPNHVLAFALGNVEPLPAGDVFVGWGTGPNYSEFTKDGNLLYNASLPSRDDSYRAYLRSWSGLPTTKPSLAVTGTGPTTQVAMSWNGATKVASWKVRTGADRSALRDVVTAPATGFQTSVQTGTLGVVVQVEALSSAGKVLGSTTASS